MFNKLLLFYFISVIAVENLGVTTFKLPENLLARGMSPFDKKIKKTYKISPQFTTAIVSKIYLDQNGNEDEIYGKLEASGLK